MDEFENFVENGEFFVEYADHYLGSGSVVWSLLPQMLEARRDGRTALQLRSISNIKWQLKITLDGGDQFWNLFDSKDEVDFSGFSGSIFSCGGVLKLFPTDPLQKGFCFCRCFPEKITRSSGSRQNAGTLELEFVCEVANVKTVIQKLRAVHPYEEPAIDIVPLLEESDFEHKL